MRKPSAFDGVKTRIHTFGNRFTQCSQVSDGGTWQEYLAQHLGEPVINYGVGGHSVYQMYLRTKMIGEADPADYVILNIWEDDHSDPSGRRAGLVKPNLGQLGRFCKDT